jgi:hypothetical protein
LETAHSALVNWNLSKGELRAYNDAPARIVAFPAGDKRVAPESLRRIATSTACLQ